ncbi:MAG: ferrous iron transport protein B [Anaerolineales bacterium]|nr:ferrous iron transport protein B [Anaerolineales bacterium]
MAQKGCLSDYPGKSCCNCRHRGRSGHKQKVLKAALVGNPNTGKTTLFNLLTGSQRHVGNYPGVTIDKVVGNCQTGRREFEITDLPGTYSISPYSLEEMVVRRYLLEETPDVVVLVVDASNLRRNLYLAIQLLELGMPLVIALNKTDVARQDGSIIDTSLLEESIGIPVVPIVASTGIGARTLLRRVADTAESSDSGELKKLSEYPVVKYNQDLESEILKLVEEISRKKISYFNASRRWIAIKLLESDEGVIKHITDAGIKEIAETANQRIDAAYGDVPESIFAELRYKWIEELCGNAVLFAGESHTSFSDKVDSVLTNRFIGIPIFLGLMYLVFHLTFSLGDPLVGFIEGGFRYLGTTISSFWEPGSDSFLRSLLVDGIIGGVGGVLVFLPNIVLLFLAISILEESGYMSRAAFLMDRIMHMFGLHGKSFIPMLLGFGCNVPAIMATRVMEDKTAQRITMLIIPLMSCGARLPIYALIIPAFFPSAWRGMTLLSLYLIGILLALLAARLLRETLYKGEPPSFMMELPPYKIPSLKSIAKQIGRQSWYYLQKAGTVILGASIIFWFLGQFPGIPEEQEVHFESLRSSINLAENLEDETRLEQLRQVNMSESQAVLENSLLGKIGHGMEFFMAPAGFDWKVSTALVGAVVAKEIFVAQLGVIYSLGDQGNADDDSLREKLQAVYNPLQAYCIMLFCLIAFPCVATVAVTKRESGSWMFAMFQLFSLTLLAWILTTAVYQFGRLFL